MGGAQTKCTFIYLSFGGATFDGTAECLVTGNLRYLFMEACGDDMTMQLTFSWEEGMADFIFM